MSDYGFAVQPLIHTLKQRSYVIGGRYQMPVYKGSVPEQLLRGVNQAPGTANKERPRTIFKSLVDSGQVEPLDKMQIVTQIADLNPEEDEVVEKQESVPSMLHHVDKTKLEHYVLSSIFRDGEANQDDGD